MNVRVTRRYIADDGMEFSSKQAAEHHEADVFDTRPCRVHLKKTQENATVTEIVKGSVAGRQREIIASPIGHGMSANRASRKRA